MFVKCFSNGPGKKRVGRNTLIPIIANGEWEKAQKSITPNTAAKWSIAPTLGNNLKPTEILPLHQACVISNVPLNIIKSLINAHPDSINKYDSCTRRTPLHLALANHSSEDVILYLLHTYPMAASAQDVYGRVPLHYGISNHSSMTVLKALIDACPQAVRATDQSCWTPFHVASSVSASLKLIELILEKQEKDPDYSCVKIVTMPNNKGNRPIDLAKESNESKAKDFIVQRLLEEENKLYQTPVFQNLASSKANHTSSTNFRVLSSGLYV